MKRALDAAVESLGLGLRDFPWEDGAAYAGWLSQTYHYVRHSTRLLAASAARFGFEEMGNQLHHRFAVHMAEEKQHELLALNDLKRMKRASLADYPELPSTRAMYESQYYKIEHVDPIALFGYVLPLEVMSAKHGPGAHERAQRTWGAGCSTFLKVHVEEDVDHVEKAVAAVEGLSGERKAMLALGFEQTAFSYNAMLKQIRDEARHHGDVSPTALRAQTA
jgi:pyrroloquinoline quinone (PQQ) biosynthesis protein C